MNYSLIFWAGAAFVAIYLWGEASTNVNERKLERERREAYERREHDVKTG